MKRAILSTMMLAIVLTVMATFATAQEPPEPLLINYQGTLADSTGSPVPDGNYLLMFRLYNDSTSGSPLWQESHSSVPISNGLFHILLGSSNPLDPDTLGLEPLFLQIMVGNETLTPRMRFTQVPEAVYAQRLKGDIATEPGSFLFRNSLGDSAIVFNADGLMSAISVRSAEPPDEHPSIEMRTLADGVAEFYMRDYNGNPALTLVSNGITNAITVRGMEPGNDGIEISASDLANAITVRSMEPPDEYPSIEMRTLADGAAEFYMRDNNGNPALTLVSNGITNAITVRGMEPPDERVQISSGIGGQASFVMFNPQPEPPHAPMVEISTTPGSNASFVMFNPQPEPPHDPLMEMMTAPTGGHFNIFSPQNGRTIADAIEISTSDSGGSMQFYDENGTHVWLSIDPDGSEGNMTFYNSDGTPTVNISSLGYVGIGTENPARNLHVNDVMRLEPRVGFPSSPGEGDLCVVGGPFGNHIYCYLNGSWQRLD